MNVVIGIAIHLVLCSVLWDALAQAQICDEVTYDNDKVGHTLIGINKMCAEIFSEGYRRYLALGFTSFARTYVRFCFCVSVFLSKRPSL